VAVAPGILHSPDYAGRVLKSKSSISYQKGDISIVVSKGDISVDSKIIVHKIIVP
jgi:hypothetical protein